MATAIKSATAGTDNGGTASVSVTTSETPSATSVGDLVVVFYGNDYYNLSNMGTPTATGAPTLTLQATCDGGANESHIKVYTYTANTAGAQTISVTETGAHDEEKWLVVYVLSGANTSSPVDGTPGTNFSATSATPWVAPATSPTAADSFLLIVLGAGGGAAPADFTTPAPLTERLEFHNGGASGVTAYYQLSASGSTGTFNFTPTGPASYGAVTLAIATSGAAAPTPSVRAFSLAPPAPFVTPWRGPVPRPFQMLGDAVPIVVGTAALTATASVTTAGALGVDTAAAVSATAAITAAGTVGTVGTASLTIAAAMAPAGATGVPSTAALTAAAAVTATGQLGLSTTATLTVAAAVTAGTLAPVSAYAFEDGTDETGHGYDLTATGSPVVTGGHTGSGTTATIGNYFEGPLGPNSSFTDWTVMAWVKVNAFVPSFRGVVANDSNLYLEFSTISGTTLILECYAGVSPHPQALVYSYTSSSTNLPWMHVAATRTAAAGVTLYIDGVQATGAGNGNPAGGNAANFGAPQFRVGGSRGNDGYSLDGVVDDLRVFDQALTGAQIAEFMALPVGVVVPSGDATLTATATVTPAGQTGLVTGAAVTASAAVTAAGVVAASTGAALTVTGTASPAGVTATSAGASLTATATVTVASAGAAAGTVALTGTVAVTAAGAVQSGIDPNQAVPQIAWMFTDIWGASFQMAGDVTLTPAGSAGASLSAAAAVTANGSIGVATTASPAAVATVTTAGSTAASTGASLAATTAVTATGSTGTSKDASLTAAATITAAGTVGPSSSAQVAVTATITPAHQATTGTSAAVSPAVVVTATGVVSSPSGTSVSVSVAVGATASTGTNQPAGLAVVVAIAATGGVGRSSGALATVTSLVTAVSSADRYTTAQVAAQAQVAAVGALTGHVGPATVTSAAVITATGAITAYATGAALTATAAAAAAGFAQDPRVFVGPVINVGPPRPGSGITVGPPHTTSRGLDS